MPKNQQLLIWREKTWTKNDYRDLLSYVKSQASETYRHFNETVINCPRTTWGVPMSVLRPLSRQIARGQNVHNFWHLPKGEVYEEVLLEGLVLASARLKPPELWSAIDYFVAKMNSWALVDTFVDCHLLMGWQEQFWPRLPKYLASSNPWAIRFAYVAMMTYYLTPKYLKAVLTTILVYQNNEYYVQMAQAWLLAEAWITQRSVTRTWLQTQLPILPTTLVKMTGQKLRDSRRVSEADKKETKQWRK
jgi:3-methyladenine DNA glycosylase AlkD